MLSRVINKYQLTSFFVFVTLLSIPFWLLGFLTDNSPLLPAGLPIGALMAICPILATFLLVFARKGGEGVRSFLRHLQTSPKKKAWLVVALLYMPLIMGACYGVMSLFSLSLPDPVQIFWTSLPSLLLLFMIGAAGEEVGWSGYILEPLKRRYGIVGAALLLGVFGAVWHSVPLLQGDHSFIWILCQCIVVFLARIITVWLYFASGLSILVVIVFHTMDNLSFALFPNDGSHYDPFIKMIVLLGVMLCTALTVRLRARRR